MRYETQHIVLFLKEEQKSYEERIIMKKFFMPLILSAVVLVSACGTAKDNSASQAFSKEEVSNTITEDEA